MPIIAKSLKQQQPIHRSDFPAFLIENEVNMHPLV